MAVAVERERRKCRQAQETLADAPLRSKVGIRRNEIYVRQKIEAAHVAHERGLVRSVNQGSAKVLQERRLYNAGLFRTGLCRVVLLKCFSFRPAP